MLYPQAAIPRKPTHPHPKNTQGAPWGMYDLWRLEPYFCGNGGFSLRSRRFMQEVLGMDGLVLSAAHEDGWLCKVAARAVQEGRNRLTRPPAPYYEEMAFAVETLIHPAPFALHAFWKHFIDLDEDVRCVSGWVGWVGGLICFEDRRTDSTSFLLVSPSTHPLTHGEDRQTEPLLFSSLHPLPTRKKDSQIAPLFSSSPPPPPPPPPSPPLTPPPHTHPPSHLHRAVLDNCPEVWSILPLEIKCGRWRGALGGQAEAEKQCGARSSGI